MDIESLIEEIKQFKPNTFINVTSVYTNNNTFGGTIVLNNGEIYTYKIDETRIGSITKITQIPIEKIENFKNYLLNNVRIFEKRYQQIKIDNREFKVYVCINGKELNLINDFIDIYEPTLYKDLCFKINYLITNQQGITDEMMNALLNQNKVNIKSSLKNFSCELTIYKSLIKKRWKIKILRGINIYKSANKNICYWTIRLLYEKYDSIWNASGATYKQEKKMNYLLANFKDSQFETLEEVEALKKTLSALFNEIKTLR